MKLLQITLISSVLMLNLPSLSASDPPKPPLAKRLPQQLETHGDRRVDDYSWLRQKTSSNVIAYLGAENAYTDALMAPTKQLQERLYREILGHLKETDSSAPLPRGEYSYYVRTKEGS